MTYNPQNMLHEVLNTQNDAIRVFVVIAVLLFSVLACWNFIQVIVTLTRSLVIAFVVSGTITSVAWLYMYPPNQVVIQEWINSAIRFAEPFVRSITPDAWHATFFA